MNNLILFFRSRGFFNYKSSLCSFFGFFLIYIFILMLILYIKKAKKIRHAPNRFYSTDLAASPGSKLGFYSAKNFKLYEWFVGLTDGEGLLLISIVNKDTSGSFKFEIGLDKYDVELLYYLQKELGIGRVATLGKAAYFTVTLKYEIALLLKIFTEHPLKSNKALNFINFKQAFELYINRKGQIFEVKEEIKILKSNMNSNRTDFEMSDYYLNNPISITPYLLLGFVFFFIYFLVVLNKLFFFIIKQKMELADPVSPVGSRDTEKIEGTLSVLKRPSSILYNLVFGLSQSYTNLVLMKAIRDFFNNLPELSSSLGVQIQGLRSLDKPAFVHIYIEKKSSNTNNKQSDMVILNITRTEYLKNVFIPLFDSMILHSKNYFYFQDWKAIFNIKEKGLNCLPEGKELIDLILSQMNTKRLSTHNSKLVDRKVLQVKIEELLVLPSNYEIKEDGRIWIFSENRYSDKNGVGVILQDESGDVVNSFESLRVCAQVLGQTINLVTRFMLKDKPLWLNNKLAWRLTRSRLVYIKKSEGASYSESGTPILESSVISTNLWLSTVPYGANHSLIYNE